MQIDLKTALHIIGNPSESETPSLIVPKGFVVPGAWVIFASTARRHHIATEDIHFSNKKTSDYSSAIGFNDCVFGEDDYQYCRKNVGSTYSPLTRLDCVESTDAANHQIVGCVKEMLSDPDLPGGVDLMNVIGELHDNVWAHGRSTGVSMAQKWKDWNDGGRPAIEFALADTGHGFLRELRRYGKPANDDIQAIDWCVTKNNSTKHADDDDDWAQSVPEDIMGGSPFGAAVPRVTSRLNHQGLGLWKLTELIRKYRGKLTLVSGTGCLQMDTNGQMMYSSCPEWRGVALSCRLYEDELGREEDKPDDQVAAIMERLGGL